jgi:hypothetical protein
MQVDVEVRSALLANPAFELMGKNVDEDEHSIEMHLPYVAKVRDPSCALIFVHSRPLSYGCVVWVWGGRWWRGGTSRLCPSWSAPSPPTRRHSTDGEPIDAPYALTISYGYLDTEDASL